jgi:hypothetical protein
MKKWPIVLVAVVLLAAGAAYAGRGVIRDRWEASQAKELPVAKPYAPLALPVTDSVADQPSVVEGGIASSQNYVLVSSPAPVKEAKPDPMALRGPLPDEVNLAVPFTIQAPDQKWVLPFEEACEEASILMVDAYYRGLTGRIPVDQAKRTIQQLVAYQDKVFGGNVHTTVEQTARMAREFFRIPETRIVAVDGPKDIKRMLANGFPVIVPAAGRMLGNPNFRGVGPYYHMFVIKGYTKDGMFITNEPGTRKGMDYVYAFDTVMQALHDYDANDMTKGAKVVLVLIPDARP